MLLYVRRRPLLARFEIIPGAQCLAKRLQIRSFSNELFSIIRPFLNTYLDSIRRTRKLLFDLVKEHHEFILVLRTFSAHNKSWHNNAIVSYKYVTTKNALTDKTLAKLQYSLKNSFSRGRKNYVKPRGHQTIANWHRSSPTYSLQRSSSTSQKSRDAQTFSKRGEATDTP